MPVLRTFSDSDVFPAALRKVLPDQGTVTGRQIDAACFHQMLSVEPVQPAFQRSFAPSDNHVIDGIILQIAESGGIAETAGEKVLVNAQNLRTHRTGPFRCHPSEIVPGPAFHRGAGDTLPFGQTAAADSVKVFLTDAAAKRLTGSAPRQNPGETLPETALTDPAQPFPGLQFQNAIANSPAFMPGTPNPPPSVPRF